jgi:hypothetical protein
LPEVSREGENDPNRSEIPLGHPRWLHISDHCGSVSSDQGWISMADHHWLRMAIISGSV